MGGVYIRVWTRVIVGIVESESTPKEEQFQVGRREMATWPITIDLKIPGSAFSAQTMGLWVALLWYWR